MAAAIGRKRWAIPDGYIPATSATDDPDMKSHETVSMLNTGDRDANVEITIYFTDRDPVVSAETIPDTEWADRMWVPTWIYGSGGN